MTETQTSTDSSIGAMFAACGAENRAALMPFLTAGYPDLDATDALLDAVVAGGADLIELGIPFSDPLADGATIQHTSQVALDNGTTLADCFAIARRFRDRGHDTPIVFMGYTNPFLQYGPEALAEAAVANGVDGFIIPDLPLEESDEFSAPLRAHGRDLIFLVAPTSTDSRIEEAASRASGFIYCVALTGVTGARSELSADLADYIERIRKHTDLPLAIGFGISKPEHVQQVSALADGVIVASALINHIDTLAPEDRAAGTEAFVRELASATTKTAR